MPLIFTPEDSTELFEKLLSLEIYVTRDTKQYLPRLWPPTAKNASNKTLF